MPDFAQLEMLAYYSERMKLLKEYPRFDKDNPIISIALALHFLDLHYFTEVLISKLITNYKHDPAECQEMIAPLEEYLSVLYTDIKYLMRFFERKTPFALKNRLDRKVALADVTKQYRKLVILYANGEASDERKRKFEEYQPSIRFDPTLEADRPPMSIAEKKAWSDRVRQKKNERLAGELSIAEILASLEDV